jgi:hypothetical protein
VWSLCLAWGVCLKWLVLGCCVSFCVSGMACVCLLCVLLGICEATASYMQTIIDILHHLAQSTSRISYMPLLFRVCVGNDDGSIFVYDTKTAARVMVWRKHVECV